MMNKPEKKIVAAPVAATIWKNKSLKDDSTYRTVTIERRYKDREGKWQSTNSFRVADLPKVNYVCSKAFEYILENPEEYQGGDQAQSSEETVM